MLAVGRGDLAVFSLIAGPGLLMLVATMFPEVPARYSRIGVTDAPPEVTAEEIAIERRRYPPGRPGSPWRRSPACGSSAGCLAPVSEAQAIGPVTFDERLAQQGASSSRSMAASPATVSPGRRASGLRYEERSHRTRRLTDGTVQPPTDEYLRESIAQPNAKVVNGFASGVMLSAVSPRLPEITQPSNMDALINYIKSLAP